MNKDIYILGVGHNTPVYIELCEACGYNIVGLYHFNDDLTGQKIYDYRVLGSNKDLFQQETLEGMNFALSMGDNNIRQNLFNIIKKKKGSVPNLIHPTSTISRFAKLGEGCIVQTNSIIFPNASIGDNTVLSINVTIIHDSQVGNNCYLAGYVEVGAYCKVESNVFIGIGSKVISGKVNIIGEGSYIGAGSLITKNIEPYTLVMGSPAKTIKKLK